MKIRTKSIYDEKDPSDGTRILITRFYPRGVKRTRFDLWIRGVSPQPELLKEYKSGGITWSEFSRRFGAQLSKLEESKEAINQLIEILRTDDITLLCYEKEGENCHRTIVKSRILKMMSRKKKASASSLNKQ